MPEHSPHDPAAFRITKLSLNKLVAQLGEDDDMARAAKYADDLLELASCPNCHVGVPMISVAIAQVPSTASSVIMHLTAALAKANAMIIKGSDNYLAADDETRAKLREYAGVPGVPDFAPDA